MKNLNPADWDNSDALDDDDIDTMDIPSLPTSFFQNDTVRPPSASITIALPMDRDVVMWFRSQGADWQERMSDALRQFAKEHKVHK